MNEADLKILLEPLKQAHFVKEHRYQLQNVAAFNLLISSLESLYDKAEIQMSLLEQEIALYKLETEK